MKLTIPFLSAGISVGAVLALPLDVLAVLFETLCLLGFFVDEGSATLLELLLAGGRLGVKLTTIVPATFNSPAECFSCFRSGEPDSHDAVLLQVEDGEVLDFAKLRGRFHHVFVDVLQSVRIVAQYIKGKDVLDDSGLEVKDSLWLGRDVLVRPICKAASSDCEYQAAQYGDGHVPVHFLGLLLSLCA